MNHEYTRAPHRWGATPEEHSPNAALLIDFDNVTMGIRSNLGAELRKLLDSDMIRGKVAVQRAYADWRRYPQYIVPLSEVSIDLIFAPAYGSSRKNATDIRLAIDALELVFTRPEIGTYILLSGDSDFSSLVLKLKEYGKYVIGVGLQESSSDILVQNCDEYYSYTSLSGLTSAADMEHARLDPWELVEEAVARMASRGDVMRSDRLKQVMLELDPTFDEKSAGFSKFNRFLAEAAGREIVLLRKAPNGQYEVAPGRTSAAVEEPVDTTAAVAASSAASAETEAKPASRRRGSRRGRAASRAPAAAEAAPAAAPAGEPAAGEPASAEAKRSAEVHRIHTEDLRSAYAALQSALRELAKDRGDQVRDSEVKRKLISRDEGFDEGALGFRKFSRFLAAARDEGVIDLTQGEDGNYYLTLPAEAAAAAAEAAAPAPEAAAEEAGDQEPGAREKRGSGRRRRKSGRRTRGDRGRAAREATEAEASEAAGAAAEVAGETADSTADLAEAGAGAPGEPAGGLVEAAEPPASQRKAPEAREPARRGLGRFRRGSRGRGGAASGAAVGPVDEPSGDAGRPEAGEPPPAESRPEAAEAKAPAAEAASQAPDPEADRPSRGLGRYRGGSRGRGTPPDTGTGAGVPPDAGTGAGAPADPGVDAAPAAEVAEAYLELEPGGPAAEAVEHMVRSYGGVGRRTAERLVDAFGSQVFQVIDSDPEKLYEVLSKGRAKAVIAAREEERSAAGGSP